MPEFARTASPLHALLKKDTVFSWTYDCEDAFTHLKEVLVHAPVLAYPQFDNQHPFLMETDPSTQGLGVVLAQQQSDGRVHLIAFASRSLSPAEQKYITRVGDLHVSMGCETVSPLHFGSSLHCVH